MNNNQKHKEHIRKTLKEKYGQEVTSVMQIPEIHQKFMETMKKKYGSTCLFSSNYGKEKIKQYFKQKYNVEHNFQIQQVKEIRNETWLKKYGTTSIFKSEKIKNKIKQTQVNKYGSYFSQSSDFKELYCNEAFKENVLKKINETKRANNSFKFSKPEEETYNLICEKFSKDNIIRQFKSEKYPFLCDFYIKSLDLFIECNYSWTHGGCFFDENNQFCIEKLTKWKEKAKKSKFYQNAIETWTKRDVMKLKVAKQNKLNFKVFGR